MLCHSPLPLPPTTFTLRHCNVPYRYEGDKTLGTWVARQRKERDNLTLEQVEKLNEVGFTWKSAQERVWMEKVRLLQTFLVDR